MYGCIIKNYDSWLMYSLSNQSHGLLSNSSKKKIMCSDLDEPFFSINAYLWGSIIAVIIFSRVLGLMIRSGLYLWHHKYKGILWGQIDASST